MYGLFHTTLEIAVVNQKCVHKHFSVELFIRYESKFLTNRNKANLEASYNKLTSGDQKGEWIATLLSLYKAFWFT